MKEKIISLVNLVSLFFQKLFLLMIRFYQAAISPHLGKNCRFTPTCSQYAYIAITRFGPIKGIHQPFGIAEERNSCTRILRGEDLVLFVEGGKNVLFTLFAGSIAFRKTAR